MSTNAPNVLPFRSRSDAPVAVLPRNSFGLREPVSPAERAALGDRTHVDPSLMAELSAKVGIIAEMCERLSDQAKFLGDLRAAVTLREHQSLLETLSAELAP